MSVQLVRRAIFGMRSSWREGNRRKLHLNRSVVCWSSIVMRERGNAGLGLQPQKISSKSKQDIDFIANIILFGSRFWGAES
jgi:hypothetical protein